MDETGVVSVDTPTIKHHPGKANIIADSLSRSQKNLVKIEKPKESKEPKEKGTLFALTTHIEMDQQERHRWITAYESDPCLWTALRNLRQGRRVDDFLLTSTGLIGIKKHVHKKFVILVSLHQDILKKCHDAP